VNGFPHAAEQVFIILGVEILIRMYRGHNGYIIGIVVVAFGI
jgi:hypothetical protein